MRIYKSEKLWAVSVYIEGHSGPAFYGGVLVPTKKLCAEWIRGESDYFRKAYKPRPCRVLVTVEGER